MPSWIDYRRELEVLFHGDHTTVAQSYWIVIRMMRLGQFSQYWHDAYQEAIGGPKWKYDDRLVRCIAKPGASARTGLGKSEVGSQVIAEIGIDDVGGMIYALEASSIETLGRIPSQHDIIYEIDKAASDDKPESPLKVVDRLKILKAFPIRGDNGRIELIYLGASRVHGES